MAKKPLGWKGKDTDLRPPPGPQRPIGFNTLAPLRGNPPPNSRGNIRTFGNEEERMKQKVAHLIKRAKAKGKK